jgi:hypothetical protein
MIWRDPRPGDLALLSSNLGACRMCISGLYLLAPFMIFRHYLFYEGRSLTHLAIFSTYVLACWSLAHSIKYMILSKKISNFFENFKGQFDRLAWDSFLCSGEPIHQMSADIGSLLQKLDRRAISRHIKQFNNVILLLQSRCDGDYISTYHSMASKNLKIILVPDDADTVRTDHARRFALYHELGHTTPLNAGIFARRYFDGAFF